MSTTDVFGASDLSIGGQADVEFVHGDAVASDIQVLWDFGAGLEAITDYVLAGDSATGRDWPSQLQGKAGPGRLSLDLNNDDDRFSYFNTDSPLNQGGRSLDPGGKIRVQIAGTTGVDPELLVFDEFGSDLAPITTDDLGTPWEHQGPHVFARVFGSAAAPAAGQESLMVIDTGQADYYVQTTISELGDHVVEATGLQENNEVRLIYRWQDASNYSYLAYATLSNGQQHTIEGVDVVAGTPSSIYGPFADVTAGGAGTDAAGDHRRRVTIGVHVDGAEAHYYVNGCRRTTVAETALQTDETHVGLYAYYGVGNRAPAVERIAVWDTVPTSAEGVIWTGTVVDVFPVVTAGPHKTVRVTAEGALAGMAAVSVQPQAWAGQMRTGIALGDAVERAGLLYPPGELARGEAFAGSSSDAEINALTHVRKLEEVEIGFLHEAPEGWLVYRDRSYRDDLATAATFTDTEGAQFQYQDFELLQWRRELVNKVTAGVSYGAPNIVLLTTTKAGTASGVARTVTFTMPASINDGDLFVVMIASTIADDDENWLVPLWWVRERDTGASSSKRSQVYSHIGAASEASSTVTFYNDSASAGGSYILNLYQFRDWYGSHDGIHIGEWSIGESFAGADPQVIMPPWGDTNPSALIAVRFGVSTGGAGSITNPTYPLGYVNSDDDFQNGSGSNIHDAGMLTCSKLAMTSLEDPSSFTGFSGLNNAETSVIAVRGRNGSPPEPHGRLRVTVEDQESQRRHATVASYDGTDLFPSEELAEAWCELMLTRYARLRPIVRFSFTATRSAGYRAQAYRRRLGDKIRVVATGNAGMGIDGDFHIENIAHRWSKGTKLWVTTWELSPAG